MTLIHYIINNREKRNAATVGCRRRGAEGEKIFF